MKKTLALILLLFSLSACAKGPKPDEIAKTYQNARELSAQATVSAITDVIAEYDLSYKLSGGTAEVTILRPEALEGVTAQLLAGSAVMRYDGASAETLLPGIPGFTPVDALHMLLYDLANSVAQDIRHDKTSVSLTYCGVFAESALEKHVRLDAATLAVSSCEFFVDGRMVMRMDVSAMNVF